MQNTEASTSLLKTFGENFIRFDFLIFLLAIINAYILWRLYKEVTSIDKKLYPSGHLAGGKESYEDLAKHYKDHVDVKGEQSFIALRKRMNLTYSLFENITAVFPLMGLLGTVISLIPMVNSVGLADTTLFFSALTSTFWGIVFAIIYKAFNGYVSGMVEESEKGIQLFLERRSALLYDMSVRKR